MHTYIVSINSEGLGHFALGHVTSETKKDAQKQVFDLLVASGMPQHKIGQQVTDNTTLQVGKHTITIVLLQEFDFKKASTLVALIQGD